MIVAPGKTNPFLCKPVIDPELKYISKFISIKIANSINGINFESKSLIIYPTSLNDTSYFINLIFGATDNASLKFLSSSNAIISPLTSLSPAKLFFI